MAYLMLESKSWNALLHFIYFTPVVGKVCSSQIVLGLVECHAQTNIIVIVLTNIFLFMSFNATMVFRCGVNPTW